MNSCFREILTPRRYLLVRTIFAYQKANRSTNNAKSENAVGPSVSTASSPEALARSGLHHAEAKSKKISKAMVSFLKAMSEKEKFIMKENAEYELGKRHLANMMSMDPDTMTEKDVAHAIEYLFPSGLFSPRSRPQMTKPEKLYPPIAPPQFAMSGRPFDDMFYTLKPALYQTLYEIYERIEKVIKYEERETMKGNQPAEMLAIPDGTWKHFLPGLIHVGTVPLLESDLKKVESALDYFSSLPYSYIEKDFILSMRIAAASVAQIEERPVHPIFEENGRKYCVYEAHRKFCTAIVKVFEKGTGKITVNDRDLFHFRNHQSRQTILAPLYLLNRIEQFDVEATTTGRGESAQSGAVRLGIALALQPFITEEEIIQLELAGLLSRDPRRKERNKPAKVGPRARRQWKKR